MGEQVNKDVNIYQDEIHIGIISMELLMDTLIKERGFHLDIMDFYGQLVGNGATDFEGFSYEILNGKEVSRETS